MSRRRPGLIPRRTDQPEREVALTLWELLDGRCEEGILSREAFQALLNRCWSEVMAERVIRRRRRRGQRRRSFADPFETVDTPFDMAELR